MLPPAGHPLASPVESVPADVLIFEETRWSRFLPVALTRPVFDLRVGTETLISRVERLLKKRTAAAHSPTRSLAGAWCRHGLTAAVSASTGLESNGPLKGATLLLNGRGIWRELPDAGPGGSWLGVAGPNGPVACLFADDDLAPKLQPADLISLGDGTDRFPTLPRRDVSNCVELLDWPWKLVQKNRELLLADLGSELRLGELPAGGLRAEGIYLLNSSQIRIGEGGKIWPANVIDAEEGPVWIGERVRILPHCSIQGPAFIGDDCLLQAGTVIRGGTTLGPCCKVGGEIEGSIFQGYSNKQHTGFLGHSYVGSWANLGAGCSNSDLKHTYGTVRVPINGTEVETVEMFVGALIGDHAKIGINCSIPTGTSIGFASAVSGSRCPKFVPSFAWIEEGRLEAYEPTRALAVAQRMMARRQKSMSDAEQAGFLASAAVARQWEQAAR